MPDSSYQVVVHCNACTSANQVPSSCLTFQCYVCGTKQKLDRKPAQQEKAQPQPQPPPPTPEPEPEAPGMLSSLTGAWRTAKKGIKEAIGVDSSRRTDEEREAELAAREEAEMEAAIKASLADSGPPSYAPDAGPPQFSSVVSTGLSSGTYHPTAYVAHVDQPPAISVTPSQHSTSYPSSGPPPAYAPSHSGTQVQQPYFSSSYASSYSPVVDNARDAKKPYDASQYDVKHAGSAFSTYDAAAYGGANDDKNLPNGAVVASGSTSLAKCRQCDVLEGWLSSGDKEQERLRTQLEEAQTELESQRNLVKTLREEMREQELEAKKSAKRSQDCHDSMVGLLRQRIEDLEAQLARRTEPVAGPPKAQSSSTTGTVAFAPPQRFTSSSNPTVVVAGEPCTAASQPTTPSSPSIIVSSMAPGSPSTGGSRELTAATPPTVVAKEVTADTPPMVITSGIPFAELPVAPPTLTTVVRVENFHTANEQDVVTTPAANQSAGTKADHGVSSSSPSSTAAVGEGAGVRNGNGSPGAAPVPRPLPLPSGVSGNDGVAAVGPTLTIGQTADTNLPDFSPTSMTSSVHMAMPISVVSVNGVLPAADHPRALASASLAALQSMATGSTYDDGIASSNLSPRTDAATAMAAKETVSEVERDVGDAIGEEPHAEEGEGSDVKTKADASKCEEVADSVEPSAEEQESAPQPAESKEPLPEPDDSKDKEATEPVPQPDDSKGEEQTEPVAQSAESNVADVTEPALEPDDSNDALATEPSPSVSNYAQASAPNDAEESAPRADESTGADATQPTQAVESQDEPAKAPNPEERPSMGTTVPDIPTDEKPPREVALDESDAEDKERLAQVTVALNDSTEPPEKRSSTVFYAMDVDDCEI